MLFKHLVFETFAIGGKQNQANPLMGDEEGATTLPSDWHSNVDDQ